MINRSKPLNHDQYMEIALGEAKEAAQNGEVPVGAVLVDLNGNILSSAHNQTIHMNDPTAHAEILAIRKAAEKIQNYRLPGTTLVSTIEPCIMCMGAMVHARIATLVFGTTDPKWGAAGSLYHFAEDGRLNHRPKVIGGVCEGSCRDIMQAFFRERRG
ncbi:MAG: tRNA adenosine(34) deaminase TadA [Deltaproteobacteria bacterium]|jgi:tRNA(adenine34) deaminase